VFFHSFFVELILSKSRKREREREREKEREKKREREKERKNDYLSLIGLREVSPRLFQHANVFFHSFFVELILSNQQRE
jgi:hypothetical protein